LNIGKKRISEKEGKNSLYDMLNQRQFIEKEAKLLGNRFHGSREDSLEEIRREGLKVAKTEDNAIIFSDASAANSPAYSRGGKWNVVHSVPKGYFDEMKKQGKMTWNDYYAGHEEKHALFDIPPKRIKTYVMNVKRGGLLKSDPLLSRIEKKMNKEGKSMGGLFIDPARLQHEINYYTLLVADEEYEQTRNTMREAVKKQLEKNGRVTFADMKKTVDKMIVFPELRDYVIGNVFLDMKLKKSGNGFKK